MSKSLKELLVHNPNYKLGNMNLKKRLINEKLLQSICNICNISTIWNNQKIVLHLDHINGDIYDNRLENLRFLCPNCHSQTDTYCRKKSHFDNKYKKDFDKVLGDLHR